jgi:excisionase family DNA binding protein
MERSGNGEIAGLHSVRLAPNGPRRVRLLHVRKTHAVVEAVVSPDPSAAQVTTLDEIARNPARAAEVPSAERSRLIAQCAAIVMALTRATPDTVVSQQTDPPPPALKGDHLLTVDEVAGRLKLTKARIYELVRGGQIPAVHCGRYWRLRPAEVERFIAKNEGIRR